MLLQGGAWRRLYQRDAAEEWPCLLCAPDIAAALRWIVEERPWLWPPLRLQEPVELCTRREPLHQAPLLLVLRAPSGQIVLQVVGHNFQNQIVFNEEIAGPRDRKGQVAFCAARTEWLRYEAILWRVNKPCSLLLQWGNVLSRMQALKDNEAIGPEDGQGLCCKGTPLGVAGISVPPSITLDNKLGGRITGTWPVCVDLWPRARGILCATITKWLVTQLLGVFRRHGDTHFEARLIHNTRLSGNDALLRGYDALLRGSVPVPDTAPG
mmetsp:Transcript_29550/g.81198  ORF Transcript_29550/g.81198 Transcript_29550/m.81198 type:complete len:267 (+) Transcript_29550:462-1262(+)